MITKRSIRIETVPARNYRSIELFDALSALVVVLLVLALTMTLGCAGPARISPAVALQTMNSSLVLFDIAADERIELYRAGRKARMLGCRDKDLGSSEAREKCMGPYKESIEEHVEEAAQAFNLAVIAMDALGHAFTEIDRAVVAAEETYGEE